MPSYDDSYVGSMLSDEIIQTIESKVDELSEELRELSLKIHGAFTSPLTTASGLQCSAGHPELGFEE